MDLTFRIIWFEDVDEWYNTTSRRVSRYIKNKNLGNMIRKEDYEEYEMPMTHFLKIGLKEVDINYKIMIY